jgi:hypothetical protein
LHASALSYGKKLMQNYHCMLSHLHVTPPDNFYLLSLFADLFGTMPLLDGILE